MTPLPAQFTIAIKEGRMVLELLARKKSGEWLCLLAFLLGLTFAAASSARAQSKPARWPSPLHNVLADYDTELRLPDGRVDIDAMVARLKELGATSHYWLIWHASTDWDDLKLFLPKAAVAGIAVTAYLVPPTESPPSAAWYSEPFRLDYKRWAEEIARLSLAHPNLTGWVIDDFFANQELFTPAYVGEIQARAKRINSRLVFMPLVYYNEIMPRFAEDYGHAIDGVVAAYPRDREEVERAWAVLDGKPKASATRRFHIPLIVMTAGDVEEFRKRHGEPATPERIAEWIRICLQAWHDRKCEGVVTYCLDKRLTSRSFPLARQLFKEFGAAK